MVDSTLAGRLSIPAACVCSGDSPELAFAHQACRQPQCSHLGTDCFPKAFYAFYSMPLQQLLQSLYLHIRG
eukprot:16407-Heterococcus_DN1.PRE.3